MPFGSLFADAGLMARGGVQAQEDALTLQGKQQAIDAFDPDAARLTQQNQAAQAQQTTDAGALKLQDLQRENAVNQRMRDAIGKYAGQTVQVPVWGSGSDPEGGSGLGSSDATGAAVPAPAVAPAAATGASGASGASGATAAPGSSLTTAPVTVSAPSGQAGPKGYINVPIGRADIYGRVAAEALKAGDGDLYMRAVQAGNDLKREGVTRLVQGAMAGDNLEDIARIYNDTHATKIDPKSLQRDANGNISWEDPTTGQRSQPLNVRQMAAVLGIVPKPTTELTRTGGTAVVTGIGENGWEQHMVPTGENKDLVVPGGPGQGSRVWDTQKQAFVDGGPNKPTQFYINEQLHPLMKDLEEQVLRNTGEFDPVSGKNKPGKTTAEITSRAQRMLAYPSQNGIPPATIAEAAQKGQVGMVPVRRPMRDEAGNPMVGQDGKPLYIEGQTEGVTYNGQTFILAGGTFQPNTPYQGSTHGDARAADPYTATPATPGDARKSDTATSAPATPAAGAAKPQGAAGANAGQQPATAEQPGSHWFSAKPNNPDREAALSLPQIKAMDAEVQRLMQIVSSKGPGAQYAQDRVNDLLNHKNQLLDRGKSGIEAMGKDPVIQGIEARIAQLRESAEQGNRQAASQIKALQTAKESHMRARGYASGGMVGNQRAGLKGYAAGGAVDDEDEPVVRKFQQVQPLPAGEALDGVVVRGLPEQEPLTEGSYLQSGLPERQDPRVPDTADGNSAAAPVPVNFVTGPADPAMGRHADDPQAEMEAARMEGPRETASDRSVLHSELAQHEQPQTDVSDIPQPAQNVPPERPRNLLDDKSFSEAFAAARQARMTEFQWRGKLYNTKLAQTPQQQRGLAHSRQQPGTITLPAVTVASSRRYAAGGAVQPLPSLQSTPPGPTQLHATPGLGGGLPTTMRHITPHVPSIPMRQAGLALKMPR